MTERTHHACFSGDVTCSGCDPCPSCQKHVRACVLPVAVSAAGYDGALLADLHLLADVVRAAADRMRSHAVSLDKLGLRTESIAIRRDADKLSVERIPLSDRTLAATEEDQIRAFLDGYETGWLRLHEAMEGNPAVAGEIVRTLVRPGEAYAPSQAALRDDARPAVDVSTRFDVFGDGRAVVARERPLTPEDVEASVEEVAASSLTDKHDEEPSPPLANGTAQA